MLLRCFTFFSANATFFDRLRRSNVITGRVPVKILGFLAVLLVQSANVCQAVESLELLDQLESLQNENHIRIEGLDKIQNHLVAKPAGNPAQQIKELLAGYNHVVIRDKRGKIERIVILTQKSATTQSRIVLPAKMEGSHFTVEVALSGDGRLWQNTVMVLDTGADLIVLPESMIEPLGLSGNAFTQATMQTANGSALAKIGRLKEVKFGGETVENVEAAFVPDRLLGQSKLLGMSLLGRFRFDIDDKNQLITLMRKPSDL